MTRAFFVCLFLVLSGCGIATFKSETITEKDTTYIPLDIEEQILGYTQGDCTQNSLKQRFFVGATSFWANPDTYVYQMKMVLNTDGTYDASTRVFMNSTEVGPRTFQSGSFQIVDDKLQLENIGLARVELGTARSHIKFDLTTPYGSNILEIVTLWGQADVAGTPLCP